MKENFSLQTAKIVGTPAGEYWSQTHSFFPEEQKKKEKRGILLAAFVIKGLGGGIEAVAVGREVLSRLHEEYYGNLEGSAFERLGSAVQKVCREEGSLGIAAAVLLGNVLYLAGFGNCRILLKREDKLGILLTGKGESLQVASGFVKDNDLLILGSDKFFNAVGEGVLRASVESGGLNEATELLAPTILGRSEMADSVAILALLKKEEGDSLEKKDIFEKFSSELKSPSRERIVVRRQETKNRKKIFFGIALGLLVLLTAGAVWGIRRKFSLRKEEMKSPTVETKQETGPTVVIDSAPLFMDLNLIEDGVVGVSMVLSGKNLAILDDIKKEIYLLDYEKKSFQSFGTPVEEGKMLADMGEEKIAVFSSKGIGVVNTKDKTNSVKIKSSDKWKEVVGFASFNRNFYLLDKGAGTIWRYAVSGDGYGPEKSWFAEKPPDLSTAVSLAINGSVWVLQKEGILKFNLGRQENFSLSKMPEGFDNPVKIYTTENDENLYVMDKGKGKIYQIAKSGEFKIAYAWEGIKEAADFVAVESAKKIFLLSGTEIYEVGIK